MRVHLISLLLGLHLAGCATTVDALTPGREVGVETAPSMNAPTELRFAVVGDTGRDGPVQRQIALRMREVCAGRCDFTILLGDNLYWEGLRPEHLAEDERRLLCLLAQYPEGPKYLVLGNHDYNPAFPDLERAGAQLAVFDRPGDDLYGGRHFYRFETPLASFFGLDTNYLVRRLNPEKQPDELTAFERSIAAAKTPWTIAFGHHPVRSNGQHGNAGTYLEGDRYRLWAGGGFRHFMQEHVVPHAHLYLSGHDHSMQFFGHVYGTAMAQAIAGAGAKCDDASENPTNPAMMERYGNGFAIVTATEKFLSVRYHQADGSPFFEARRGRRSGWRAMPPWGPSVDRVNHCEADHDALEKADTASGAKTCD